MLHVFLDSLYLQVTISGPLQFKVDRLQIIVVAKKYIYVSQLFISRMPKMHAIPQVSYRFNVARKSYLPSEKTYLSRTTRWEVLRALNWYFSSTVMVFSPVYIRFCLVSYPCLFVFVLQAAVLQINRRVHLSDCATSQWC